MPAYALVGERRRQAPEQQVRAEDKMVSQNPMWVCHFVVGVAPATKVPFIDSLLTDEWYDRPDRDDINVCTWLGISNWAADRASTVNLELPWDELPAGLAGWEQFHKFGTGPFTDEFSIAIGDVQPTALELITDDGTTVFEQLNTWDDQRIFCTPVEAAVVQASLKEIYAARRLQVDW